MISNIKIKGFKSLLDLEMSCSKLNVLVGGNAAGKSTLIQTLLLLRQSVELEGRLRNLKLNGPLFAGGKATDIFHPESNRKINFFLDFPGFGEIDIKTEYEAEEPNRRELAIKNADDLNPRGALFERDDQRFAYLNAERVGPRIRHPLSVEIDSIAGALGVAGEYVADVLTSTATKRNSAYGATWVKKIERLRADAELSSDAAESLNEQARAALEYVIPGAEMRGARFEELDNAGLSYSHSDVHNIRPTHIGFGLSYSLPVVVAPLLVGPEGLVIIENPEAHLHPLGQSRMGRYLALAASDGPQIFIETHSDHVVNGIRRAVKNGWLEATQVSFHFFEKRYGEDVTTHTPIQINSEGALSNWPEGFFDQFENDLSRL